MGTFLFEDIVFGPVKSRRLGVSLGINVLPGESKLCNYNCIYCECGFSKFARYEDLPSAKKIISRIEASLKTISMERIKIDAITFAGNGEPTMHPDFPLIMEKTIQLRNKYLSDVNIVVLTNATRLENIEILNALNKADKALLKIDTLIQKDFDKVNCPVEDIDITRLPMIIKNGIDNIYIQTMFFRYRDFDNTCKDSLDIYIDAIKFLKPLQVMIYSVARDTPVRGIERVNQEELIIIGDRIRKTGTEVLITA
jgi:wyosine [tRNA(Phe)-imidazoG37] synthetase (radical SAM superfamily)